MGVINYRMEANMRQLILTVKHLGKDGATPQILLTFFEDGEIEANWREDVGGYWVPITDVERKGAWGSWPG